MRVSMLGTRGIPARYGGFETCVEEISTRLASRGHEITVYCIGGGSNTQDTYKGVKLIRMPEMNSRYANFPLSALVSTASAVCSNSQIIHYFGCGRIPLTLVGRLFGKAAVLTLDGLEWNRPSYPHLARVVLKSYAELATTFPNATIVDSMSCHRWYAERTGREPDYVPYGVIRSSEVKKEFLEKRHLERGRYLFFVGRLVPEKGVHTLIDAFSKVRTDAKLVIVGGFPEHSSYVSELRKTADDRVQFLGFVYGEELETLRNAAMACVHPSTLEGTSIALLSSIGAGRCIVSSDLEENRDAIGDAAIYFETGNAADLRRVLQNVVDNPELKERHERLSGDRADQMDDWESITDHYEGIYTRVLRARKRNT